MMPVTEWAFSVRPSPTACTAADQRHRRAAADGAPNLCEIASRTSSTISDGSRLVFLGPDEISVDRLFAQCLARFEPVQTAYKNEAITIAPNQDWALLPDIQRSEERRVGKECRL